MSIDSLSSALGVGQGSSGLAKLQIVYETKQKFVFDGRIDALFNPSHLRYDGSTEWTTSVAAANTVTEGHQIMEFGSVPPTTLTVDLFFDTYEGAAHSGETGLIKSLASALTPDNPFGSGSPSAVSVVQYTDKVASLARVNTELHRPPVCQLRWGKQQLIQGVLTRLGQDFTFFMPDGTPVRAMLTCTFKVYLQLDKAAREAELHSADVVKKRVVRRGETLAAIAAEVYDDPSQWRVIADGNGIDNPRAIKPGQVLVIPKLET